MCYYALKYSSISDNREKEYDKVQLSTNLVGVRTNVAPKFSITAILFPTERPKHKLDKQNTSKQANYQLEGQ